jgi:hypothetical protein
MPDVTVEFREETLAKLDERAVTAHGGDRDEAATALLAAFLDGE